RTSELDLRRRRDGLDRATKERALRPMPRVEEAHVVPHGDPVSREDLVRGSLGDHVEVRVHDAVCEESRSMHCRRATEELEPVAVVVDEACPATRAGDEMREGRHVPSPNICLRQSRWI